VTRTDAVRLIVAARTPADLFGADGSRAYRRLARLVHPDAGGPREAFDLLTALWRAYGPVTIKTRRGTYALGATPVRGDLTNLYDAGDAMIKIPRDPGVNDLLEREAVALRQPACRHRPRPPGPPSAACRGRHLRRARCGRGQLGRAHPLVKEVRHLSARGLGLALMGAAWPLWCR
jgi:hypothetical protein